MAASTQLVLLLVMALEIGPAPGTAFSILRANPPEWRKCAAALGIAAVPV
jgi:hypothetical protein